MFTGQSEHSMNVRDRPQIRCCVHFTRGDKQTRKVDLTRILIICGLLLSVYEYVNMWIIPSWILHIQ